MNKSVLALLFMGSLISVIPSFADHNQIGDNNLVKTSKKMRATFISEAKNGWQWYEIDWAKRAKGLPKKALPLES